MDEWAAVILAGGKGKRMESGLPKVLHRVCGKEIGRHVMDAIRAVHEGPLVVVVPPDASEVRRCFGDSVEYVEQAEARGTGHALLQTKRLLSGRASRLLVLYGDTPLVMPSTLSRLMKAHQSTNAAVTLLTSNLANPDGLGHIVRDSSGHVVEVVEEAEADDIQHAIAEINGGVYGLRADWLWPVLRELRPSSTEEYYLTDIIKIAAGTDVPVGSVSAGDTFEILGINDKVQLAQAEKAMRKRILRRWMLAGVTIVDPATTYLDADVTIGRDTTIYPNTTLGGESRIGKRCSLGPGTMIYDSVVGDDCKVTVSVLEEVHLEPLVDVGPYSHLRSGTIVEREVHIGNYAEVKNSKLGRGTRMGHFSYIGDADVGQEVNIGAGTITCNYDGVNHNRTVIEDNAFIGSDTMLVAPVRIGARASTGAGSVVTKDVPPGSLAIGVPAHIQKQKKKSPE